MLNFVDVRKPNKLLLLAVMSALILGGVVGEAQEPTAFSVETLGQSVEDRAIDALTFNKNGSPPFLLFCSIHGDEAEANVLCQRIKERWTADPSVLGGAHVIFIPVANPDGLAKRTRVNANRVDVNRNFPAGWKSGKKGRMTYGGPRPLSEPESRVLFNLVEDEKPYAIISVHSCKNCGGMNNFDGPAELWAEQMAKHNGFKASAEWYQETPGSFGTYTGKSKKIPTITLELPRGLNGEKSLKSNVDAVEAAIKLKVETEKTE